MEAIVHATTRFGVSSKVPPQAGAPTCSPPRSERDFARSFDVNEAMHHADELRAQGQSRAAFCFLESWLEQRGQVAIPPDQARTETEQVLNRQGDLLVDLQRFATARQTYERAYAAAQAHGHTVQMGIVANNLGLLASIGYHSVYRAPTLPYRPNLGQALTWFKRAVEHFRDGGDLGRMVKALNNAAMAATHLGQVREAFSLYAQAAAVARTRLDHAQTCKALASQAYVLYTAIARASAGEPVDGLQAAPAAWEVQARGLLAEALQEGRRAGLTPETVCDTFGRAGSVCRTWLPE